MKSIALICAAALLAGCAGSESGVRSGPQTVSPSGGAAATTVVAPVIAATATVDPAPATTTVMVAPTETRITEQVGSTGLSDTLGINVRPNSIVGTTIISGVDGQQTGFATFSRP